MVGLLSTSIQSLGLTLQRKSHLLEDGKDEFEVRRPAYKRRRWQLGMFMFVLSNIVGSTIQITTLPLPVLSTLQAAGLVFNTAFATLLLKEPFTRFSLIGTVLTCGGAAIIATFGAIGEPAHSLSQLLGLLGERQFILWMIGTMIVVVGTIGCAHVLKVYAKRAHHQPHSHELNQTQSRSLSASHLDLDSLKRSLTAKLPPTLQTRISRIRLMRGLAYALISGILSAHSLLVAKTAVELLVRTIVDHNNQFNRYQSWLILLALVFFALTQLYYLHLGLRLCSTSVLYPFVFCIYNIVAILDGLIYFRQASRLSALHAGLIALGTVVLLTGVLALSWRLDDSDPTDHIPSQNSEPPHNPLTPGMGLMHTADDAAHSPLLPIARPRSSTSASRQSANEQTPLLYHRAHRQPTLTIHPPPPDPGTKSIWAELDDEGNESDQDILASLPRASSPFLQHYQNPARRRSRGASLSSAPTSSSTLPRPRTRGSAGSADNAQHVPSRRANSLQVSTQKERRRSSAPGGIAVGGGKSLDHGSDPVEANGSAAADEANKDDDNDVSVTAAPPNDPAVPSRWDLGISKWWRGKDTKAPDDPGG